MKLRSTLIALCISLSSAPSQAQGIGDLQGASLFAMACIRFAGNAQALRNWATEKKLPPSPEAMANEMRRRDPNATSVYVASSPEVMMALISLEDGGCRIIMQHGDADRVEQSVLATLTKAGVGSAVIREDERASPAAKMRIYKATYSGQRYWSWSVVSKEIDGFPAGIREVTLTAENISAEQWVGAPVLQTKSNK